MNYQARYWLRHAGALGAALLLAAVCGERAAVREGDAAYAELRGAVRVDGSSTVYPITEAVAEEFGHATRGGVRTTVAYSGTGGGFRRFCAGETDISNASRHISDSERARCAGNGVEFLELPVAIDGIAVVVNPANDFAQCMTVAELERLWQPGSTVRRWSELRAGWPDEQIRLYGPGTASGTFDYFTEAVMGQPGASRADFTASEDDNVLVQGVAGDRWAIGYFGFAYYEENRARLRLVAVDAGAGCVAPSPASINAGEYTPLSRPLFIYVSRRALERPEVAGFVRFYLEHAAELAGEVGYVALGAEQQREAREALDAALGTQE